MVQTVEYHNLKFPYRQEERSLTHLIKTSSFKKGDIIPQTANNLWIIKKGVVKTLTWNEAGKRITLGYWTEGDVIGIPLSTIEPYEVQCLDQVEADRIPWEKGNYFFKEISHCVRQTEELLRIVRIDKMYQRLLHLLLWLGRKFGDRVWQGILINLRLTHQELADLIGSTRVTVTRLLNQLEQEKIIVRSRRFAIVITNSNLLNTNWF